MILTPRETSIIALFAEHDNHLTEKEAGEKLGLSPNTVGGNMQSILRKLKVPNRATAINRARQLGLISPGALV